jgi:hypothetical protein
MTSLQFSLKIIYTFKLTCVFSLVVMGRKQLVSNLWWPGGKKGGRKVRRKRTSERKKESE